MGSALGHPVLSTPSWRVPPRSPGTDTAHPLRCRHPARLPLRRARATEPRAAGSGHEVRGLTRWRAVLLLVVVGLVVIAGLAAVVGPQLLSSSAPPVPHFVAEGSASGVDHVYSGDFDYYVGGGVAAFDCNDDGRPELYLAGGSGPAALYLNESSVGGALQFAA